MNAEFNVVEGDVLYGDRFTDASLQLWHRLVGHAIRVPGASRSATSSDSDASIAIPWPLFLRLYAHEFSVSSDALLPLETLLVDRRRGGVTSSRWLAFTAYFSVSAWSTRQSRPPIDLDFAVRLCANSWFHGVITFEETLRRLLVTEESGPHKFLVRFSETRWSENLWTISFSSPLGVRSLRVACHRKHEPFVLIHDSSTSSAPQTSSPATPLSVAESSSALLPGSAQYSALRTAAPLSETRFAAYSPASFGISSTATGNRIPVLESALMPLSFYFILLPRAQGALTTVYSSLAELVEAKFASYSPASKPHEYTDDPFLFIPPS